MFRQTQEDLLLRSLASSSRATENNSASLDLSGMPTPPNLIERSATANISRQDLSDDMESSMMDNVIEAKLAEQARALNVSESKLAGMKADQRETAIKKYNQNSGEMVNRVVSALRDSYNAAKGDNPDVNWDSLGDLPLLEWAKQALKGEPELAKLLYHVESDFSVSAIGAATTLGAPATSRAVVTINEDLQEKLKKTDTKVPAELRCANTINSVTQVHAGALRPEKLNVVHSGDSTFMLIAAAAKNVKGFSNAGMHAVLHHVEPPCSGSNGVLCVPAVQSCTGKSEGTRVFYKDFVTIKTDLPVWDESRHVLTGSLIAHDLDRELLDKVVADRVGDANPTHFALSENDKQRVTAIHESIEQCTLIARHARDLAEGKFGSASSWINSNGYQGPLIDLRKISQEVILGKGGIATAANQIDVLVEKVTKLEDLIKSKSETESDGGRDNNNDDSNDDMSIAEHRKVLEGSLRVLDKLRAFLETATKKQEKLENDQEQVRMMAQFFCMLWQFVEADDNAIGSYCDGDESVIRYVKTFDPSNARDNEVLDKLCLPASKVALEQLATYAENLRRSLRMDHDMILVESQLWVDDRDNLDVAHDADVRHNARCMAKPAVGRSMLQLMDFYVAPFGIPLHQIKKVFASVAFHPTFLHTTVRNDMASFTGNYLILRVPNPKMNMSDMDVEAGAMSGSAVVKAGPAPVF